MDTLLAALPLLLHRFRPDFWRVIDTLDGAANVVLLYVFCVCVYVTLVSSLFGWRAGPCASPAYQSRFLCVQ